MPGRNPRSRLQTTHSQSIAAAWILAERLNAILQSCFASRARAVNATEDLSVGFHTVPHDSAIAVWADRRQRVNCAFEAIERVVLSSYDHFKRLVIFIFANFACSHTQIVSRLGGFAAVSTCFERVEITRESDTFSRRRLWKYQSN
jgi:hypothetical protein